MTERLAKASLGEAKEGYAQVAREVDVASIPDSQVVAEELERNDVQQTLQAVDSLGDTNGAGRRRDGFITLVAEHNRLGLARGDLSKGVLNLGVQRVLGHDDNDRHVLVNESERAVLEFTRENT